MIWPGSSARERSLASRQLGAIWVLAASLLPLIRRMVALHNDSHPTFGPQWAPSGWSPGD